ncbi:MAG: DUF933 domain-containing protein [Candidatus Theseobacter exili]|nr:DUF933 domain-containing protein [Candidatus Theseobacter exili]
MKIGILGLAQSGKKTVFQLLTQKKIENTHSGNVFEGNAWIRDFRVDRLGDMYKPQKLKHAEINLALIPAIETGTCEKSTWPDAARKADALCFVIRQFPSDNVFHPSATIDPKRDLETIECEVILSDLILVERRLERLEKEIRVNKKPEQQKLKSVLEKCKEALEDEKYLRSVEFTSEENNLLHSFQFLTMKPCLVVLNTGEDVPKETALSSTRNSQTEVVTVSCQMELEIDALETEEERKLFLEEIGFSKPAVERLSQAALELVGMISFFTVGKDEVRAWNVKNGSLAPQAAGAIHSDLERGFIRAEVTKWSDLLEAGSEAKTKELGQTLIKGKDYFVQDGDVFHVRFSV